MDMDRSMIRYLSSGCFPPIPIRLEVRVVGQEMWRQMELLS